MKLFVWAPLFFVLLCFSRLPTRPRIYFHGLGGECPEFEFDSDYLPKDLLTNLIQEEMNVSICVETGAGGMASAKDLRKQAELACFKLQSILFSEKGLNYIFEFGFHLVGFSQGGLIARLVYQTCPWVVPHVATLTTIGTPNLGIDRLPDQHKFGGIENQKLASLANFGSAMLEFIKNQFKTDFSKSFLQFLNTKKNPSKLIRSLNDDPFASYSGLELVNLVYFSEDYAVTPPSSATFGVGFNDLEGRWASGFEASPSYHKLGFGSLADQGRLAMCRSSGEHLMFDNREEKDFKYLISDNCFYSGPVDSPAKIRQAYRVCSLDKMRIRKWKGMVCQGWESKSPALGKQAQAVALRSSHKEVKPTPGASFSKKERLV